MAVAARNRLAELSGLALPATIAFDHRNAKALGQFLKPLGATTGMSRPNASIRQNWSKRRHVQRQYFSAKAAKQGSQLPCIEDEASIQVYKTVRFPMEAKKTRVDRLIGSAWVIVLKKEALILESRAILELRQGSPPEPQNHD
ncbi:Pc13g11460 [Penicillium rubens Wisconsin 54-1255]|uniref:Pc13g11460 protein n=1 Tax=Penicillium rubens (strain ATCC 28089 / DSM 1075 / NRRL 1951 / Wisconsin 54-1255) TaxID=500485 RepID=B6H4U9_PENRW|nr:Pc13g11460 [Penicillium rubens Wisconsin 54-1255]